MDWELRTGLPYSRCGVVWLAKTPWAPRLAIQTSGVHEVALAQMLRRPRIAVPIGLALLAILAFGAWAYWRSAKIHWAREEALPEALRRARE